MSNDYELKCMRVCLYVCVPGHLTRDRQVVLHCCSTSTDEEMEQVRHLLQFDNMKKDDMANYSTVEVMDFKISPFMRKGNSDNGKYESL